MGDLSLAGRPRAWEMLRLIVQETQVEFGLRFSHVRDMSLDFEPDRSKTPFLMNTCDVTQAWAVKAAEVEAPVARPETRLLVFLDGHVIVDTQLVSGTAMACQSRIPSNIYLAKRFGCDEMIGVFVANGSILWAEASGPVPGGARVKLLGSVYDTRL